MAHRRLIEGVRAFPLVGLSLLGIWGGQALAEETAEWKNCYAAAGEYYSVDPTLLQAIARVESLEDPSHVNENKNGTRDVGVMQINEWWFPRLEAYGGEKRLRDEPCFNIFVGAWILAQEFERGGVTWEAVGAYNAKSLDKARVYAGRVQKAYARLQGMK